MITATLRAPFMAFTSPRVRHHEGHEHDAQDDQRRHSLHASVVQHHAGAGAVVVPARPFSRYRTRSCVRVWVCSGPAAGRNTFVPSTRWRSARAPSPITMPAPLSMPTKNVTFEQGPTVLAFLHAYHQMFLEPTDVRIKQSIFLSHKADV
ncbi:unnamed protein product [Prorocentrum cordatum]|uniref:Uncharacterized protein n=1 Tax=Prorocentrum cordatum TaxID=2364126 RepID=A0ABN9SVR6_9DINO|nr:unnamed protein product [Polarella glacialis]